MDAASRCDWCGNDPLYVEYHDTEWGVPVFDRAALFERLVLEGMQAGLSWITVLRKREHMRERFFEFDIGRLAQAGERELEHWLDDAGLIRNRAKLSAMIGNARLVSERSDFADWLWSFAPREGSVYSARADVPAATAESRVMSKALKAAGFRFVGPTICYALMQSVGMVNDHLTGCVRFAPCQEMRAQWL